MPGSCQQKTTDVILFKIRYGQFLLDFLSIFFFAWMPPLLKKAAPSK